uniref:GTP-binding protein 10 n=1 Tax=Denticeps clupeoides TaxID=299321 RepID=A0AAY4AUE1_9TELE
MVWISRICCRKYGNFVDNLRLYVRGGSGGMGVPRLGGHGGDGGDVWLVSRKGVTLRQIKNRHPDKRFTGGVGADSSVQALKGEKGKDCEVFVPPGISVTTDEGKVIAVLNALGDRVCVAKGGRGGSLHSGFLPSKGQIRQIRLDLKLIADMGLVGFPNAGKSTLLTALSHAQTRIASYPFTTVRPEIGMVMYDDHKQVSVADLPGLIEGAHMNKGLGHKFLKHVERIRQLLIVVDVCGFQLADSTPLRSAFQTLHLLIRELRLYNKELLRKHVVLIINKMDLPDADEKLHEFLHQLENHHDFSHLLPDDATPEHFLKFQHIVPVSASTGVGIPLLKRLLRTSLEEQDAMATENQREDKLQELRRLQSTMSQWALTGPTVDTPHT